MRKIIGYAVEHVLNGTNKVDSRYVAESKEKAEVEAKELTELEMFHTGTYRVVPVYDI